jgi:hypothetical protein
MHVNPLTETKNELVDQIIKTYALKGADVAHAVELYYDCQTLRIQNENRERTESESDLVFWFRKWLQLGEKVIAGKLKTWIASDDAPAEAKWAYEQIGIGPIIAAGLAAYIDPAKAGYVSSLWKFAGLAPGYDRKQKGQKLAYNARLKVLCWKLGESFVKVSGKEGAVYGKLYAEFKTEELRRNETGRYAAAAARERTKKIENKKTITILESGRLIDGHLHARAKRRAVKIFLSHYWEIARRARGLEVRAPYAEAILEHDGIIHPKEKAA